MEMNKTKDLFVCGICKASFSCDSFTRFMEHKMLHVDANKRIHCSLCMKTFPKRNSLQIHLERVHAIPQRLPVSASDNTTIGNNRSNLTTTSSARCKPCASFEPEQCPSSSKSNSDDCFSSTNQLHISSSNNFSGKQGKKLCDITSFMPNSNESPENSNLSVDVLSVGNPTVDDFTLSSLNCHNDDCCSNRHLPSTIKANEEIEGGFNSVTFSSGITSKVKDEADLMVQKQNCDSINKGLVLVSNNEEHQPDLSMIDDEGKNKVKNEDENKEELKLNHVEKESNTNIDFHFLLGTTSITGNSMTYGRVEFRCMHCSYSSAWRPSLVKHMKFAHNDILAFHDILDIQNIASKLSAKQSELCKKYKIMKLSQHSKMTLKNKTRKAKRLARSKEYQDIPGKYTCSVCNKVFSRIRYLRRHQIAHKTQRSYLCDHCGKSFKTKSTLVMHSRTHSIKLYHCPQCDFVSNQTGAIHRHRQLHPNGSAVCEICGAIYTDKSTLKKHMQVHDPSRPFSCPESNCTWRFKSESLMKAHAKSHTVVGKFECTYCGYRFRHKHHLQRHVSKIHSQEISMENSASLSLASSSTSAIMDPPVANVPMQHSALSELPQTQDLSLNFTNNPNSEIIPSVIDSGVIVSAALPPGNQNVFCEQNNLLERTEEGKPEQNMIQVLVNNNGQEILISLPADANLTTDLINNGLVNLDYTDVMQQMNSAPVFMVKDLQQ